MEALAAKHRTALRWPKGDRRLLPAMGTSRARFNLLIAVGRSCAYRCRALHLARFAALGFVLELFIVKEELFASSEEKLRAAVYTLQQPVLEFHEKPPFSLETARIPLLRGYRVIFDSRDLFPTSGSAPIPTGMVYKKTLFSTAKSGPNRKGPPV